MLLDQLVNVQAGIGMGNFAMGVGDYAYDIWRQNKTWAREDNAVQRRVADLKAAGLSPVLAAGSSASSSTPISTQAPSFGVNPMDLVRMKKEIDRTDAEIAAINAKALPDKVMAQVWDKMTTLKTGEFDPDAKSQLAMNLFKSLNADTKMKTAEADRRTTEAALLSRMYQFDTAKGVFTPEMRALAGEVEYYRNLFTNGDAGDFTGAAVQIGSKVLPQVMQLMRKGRK